MTIMTVERMDTIQFEARLFGYKKTRNKDGDWVELRLQVHPEEAAPLNSVDLGQRLQCVVVPIDTDEQPMPVEKPKGGELARQAGILCSDERFREWIYITGRWAEQYGDEFAKPDRERAADYIRNLCGVTSRADLDHNEEAAEEFRELKGAFDEAHGMIAKRFP